MRTLVITIGTGKYTKYIDKMLPTLSKVFPKDELSLCIMTDDPDRFTGSKNPWMVILKEKRPTNLHLFPIEHLPWPCGVLLKFYWVKKAIDRCSLLEDYDRVVYLDAVFRVQKEWNDSTCSDNDTVNLFQHFMWDVKTPEERIALHNLNEKSFCFIPEEERENYVHAGAFYGSTKAVLEFSERVQEMLNKELRNWSIPTWHDESVVNYFWSRRLLPLKCHLGEIYDEDAPSRYPRPKEDYLLSFENCHDCQKDKV